MKLKKVILCESEFIFYGFESIPNGAVVLGMMDAEALDKMSGTALGDLQAMFQLHCTRIRPTADLSH